MGERVRSVPFRLSGASGSLPTACHHARHVSSVGAAGLSDCHAYTKCITATSRCYVALWWLWLDHESAAPPAVTSANAMSEDSDLCALRILCASCEQHSCTKRLIIAQCGLRSF